MNDANNIKIRLNVGLMGLRKGTILNLGSKQTPLTSYWQRRIKDSRIDNCLTIISDVKDNEPTEKKVVKKPTKSKNED